MSSTPLVRLGLLLNTNTTRFQDWLTEFVKLNYEYQHVPGAEDYFGYHLMLPVESDIQSDSVTYLKLVAYSKEERPHPAIVFEVTALKEERIEVNARCQNQAFLEVFDHLLHQIELRWTENRSDEDGVLGTQSKSVQQGIRKKTKPRGPTQVTKDRAAIFKDIKDKHPTWNQTKVALEAGNKIGVDNFTADTVRNAYRRMGWTWERADRIR